MGCAFLAYGFLKTLYILTALFVGFMLGGVSSMPYLSAIPHYGRSM